MLICIILLLLGFSYIISKCWEGTPREKYIVYFVTRNKTFITSWNIEIFGYEEDVDEVTSVEITKFLENVEKPVVYNKDGNNITIESLNIEYSMYIEVKSL